MKSGKIGSLLLFFFKMALAILNPLCFHINFRINLSMFARWLLEFFLEIVPKLQTNLKKIVILTILSLPIHENRICLHLFSSLIFSNDILWFSVYVIFFGKVIPNYFIHFDVILNGIVFLVLFSDFSLPIYRKVIFI